MNDEDFGRNAAQFLRKPVGQVKTEIRDANTRPPGRQMCEQCGKTPAAPGTNGYCRSCYEELKKNNEDASPDGDEDVPMAAMDDEDEIKEVAGNDGENYRETNKQREEREHPGSSKGFTCPNCGEHVPGSHSNTCESCGFRYGDGSAASKRK